MTQPKNRDEALGLLFSEIRKLKSMSEWRCVLYNKICESIQPELDLKICGDICPFADEDSCIIKNIYLNYKQVAAFEPELVTEEPVPPQPVLPEPEIPVNPEDLEIV